MDGVLPADGERELRLRYPAVCCTCGTQLPPRTRAIWDSNRKSARCLSCAVPKQEGPPSAEQCPPAPPIDLGTPGASAQRIFDRKESRRRERLRRNWWALATMAVVGAIAGGVLGRQLHSSVAIFALIGAVVPVLDLIKRPQHVAAWGVGAAGERQVGQMLDRLAAQGVLAVHDRRVPGRQTNIDHIAVSPAGVFVIDTKNVAGKVAASRTSLRVAGRRQEKMLDGVASQVGVVQSVLAELGWATLRPRGVLCFTRADLPWLRPQPRGIQLLYPRGLRRELVNASGALTAEQVRSIAEGLARRLPAA